MRRLVVVVDQATAEARDAVSKWLKANEGGIENQRGIAWWHWFQHAWLISDPENRPTEWWRDQILDRVKPGHVLIVDADGGGWSAYAKTASFAWLKTYWKKDWKREAKDPPTT